ncbi:unnamed protein product [Owenia fusiformis]|uniref:Uncharacterized protein n=1 Tax=Owenia fusiformis TaxID=6347 RepID=A0A8S4PUX8_OWEFU|nr:unnamed protein product [Owenia fusiformis]
MATDGSTHSFDFRMSKKVAELTQVVHMLFTRNHEREVELEAYKDAYEYEIEVILKDARSKIKQLEEELAKATVTFGTNSSQVADKYEAKLKKKEQEWQIKLQTSEAALKEEQNECQKVRDMLIMAQNDIEQLKGNQSQQNKDLAEELERKTKYIYEQKHIIHQLEQQVKYKEQHRNDVLAQLKQANAKLTSELDDTKKAIDESQRTKEDLIGKNKQQELEIKTLKKALITHSNTPGQKVVRTEKAMLKDYNEEIERLRKEIQRYRMELYNREGNFNRTFANTKPVLVDQRAGKVAHQSPVGGPVIGHLPRSNTVIESGRRSSIDNGITRSHTVLERMERERSFLAFAEMADELEASKSAPAGLHRLPTLGMDHKSRLGRLSKPKPIAREMLSSKQ